MKSKQLNYLIVVLLGIISSNSVYSQCSTVGYKTLTDSIFSVDDKIVCPTIIYNQPGGFTILTESSDSSLIMIADFIKKHANLKFEIGSHTDQRGSEEFNLLSSEKRAEAIKDYLIRTYAIDPNQLVAKGYGESKPIILEDTIANEENKQNQNEMYACNRRTELIIIKN